MAQKDQGGATAPAATGALARRSRLSKSERLADDIRRQITQGVLAPGERLASFKNLGEIYGAGQAAVNEAIQRLAGEGLVVTRRRAGVFVAGSAPRGGGRPQAFRPGRTLGADRTMFYRPLAAPRELRVFATDLYEDNLAVWRRVAETYSAAHPELRVSVASCLDGHLQELCRTVEFDVVETLPCVLEACGFPASDRMALAQAGRSESDLLPIVRSWLASRDTLPGIPFAVTVHYLFVNLDLLAAVGLEPETPPGGAALLGAAAEADRRLAAAGIEARGIGLGALSDMLILEGGVRWSEGGLVFSRSRTERCAEAFLRHGFLVCDPTSLPERFADGKLAYLHHCSYLPVELRTRARFRWAALPLVQPEGWPLPAVLSVVAVSSETMLAQHAIALVRCLLSDEVQLGFARQYGNIPVVAGSALNEGVLRDHPAGGDTYRYMLQHSSLAWPEAVTLRLGLCTNLPALLAGGPLSAPEAAERIRAALDISLEGRLTVEA